MLCKHGNNWCKGIAGSDDQQCTRCFSAAVFSRTLAAQPTGPLPGPLTPPAPKMRSMAPWSTVGTFKNPQGEALARLWESHYMLNGSPSPANWSDHGTAAWDELARELESMGKALPLSMHDGSSPTPATFEAIMERLLAMDEPVRQKAYTLLNASGCKINR